MNLVGVKGVGKPSVFQNDESKFYEWAKKIEDCLIGIAAHLEAMLTCALGNETDIRQSMTADKFGEDGDPTGQVDVYVQMVVQRKTCSGHLTDGGCWSIVQNCSRNGLDAWRGLHKRFGPCRRRNLLRAVMAPQRVKMEDLGSSVQAWEDMVDQYNKKKRRGSEQCADDI